MGRTSPVTMTPCMPALDVFFVFHAFGIEEFVKLEMLLSSIVLKTVVVALYGEGL